MPPDAAIQFPQEATVPNDSTVILPPTLYERGHDPSPEVPYPQTVNHIYILPPSSLFQHRRQAPRAQTEYAVLRELLASLGMDDDTQFLIIGQLGRSTENGFDWQTYLLSELAFPPDVAFVILDMVLQFERDMLDPI